MSEPAHEAQSAIISKVSSRPVAETVRALTDLLDEKGLRIFAVIDQREEGASRRDSNCARRLRLSSEIPPQARQLWTPRRSRLSTYRSRLSSGLTTTRPGFPITHLK